jgi:amidophosphoribosyltransferase
MIGADGLIYQDLDDLIAAAREGNPHIERFDCSVFNGDYVTGDIDEAYLDKLQTARNDAAKKKKNGEDSPESTIVDLSNGA